MMAPFEPEELMVAKLRPTKSACSARKAANLSAAEISVTGRWASTSFSSQEKKQHRAAASLICAFSNPGQ